MLRVKLICRPNVAFSVTRMGEEACLESTDQHLLTAMSATVRSECEICLNEDERLGNEKASRQCNGRGLFVFRLQDSHEGEDGVTAAISTELGVIQSTQEGELDDNALVSAKRVTSGRRGTRQLISC